MSCYISWWVRKGLETWNSNRSLNQRLPLHRFPFPFSLVYCFFSFFPYNIFFSSFAALHLRTDARQLFSKPSQGGMLLRCMLPRLVDLLRTSPAHSKTQALALRAQDTSVRALGSWSPSAFCHFKKLKK